MSKVRIDNTFFSQKNFAGMYFHPKIQNYPTILFFRTGSYTMMGGKQMKILKECETYVKTVFETFDKKKA